MFVSQGWSGSHLKKLGGGFLTVVDQQVAAGAALVTFGALPVDGSAEHLQLVVSLECPLVW